MQTPQINTEIPWPLRFLLFGYRFIFAVGVGLTLAYAFSPALYQRSPSGVFWAAVVLLLLIALRVAEGAEIAVNTVLNRDDEQIKMHPVPVDLAGVGKLRSQKNDFVTGRQLLVTVLVLALGLVCALLEHTGAAAVCEAGEPAWLSELLQLDEHDLYAFWFPIVAVLVFAQIPSKIAAEQHPMRFYSSGLTQLLIGFASGVGRYLGLGLLIRRFATPEEAAEPSRLQLYEAAAAFGNGIGIDEADIVLEIDSTDGSATYRARYVMTAYGRESSSRLPQEDFWDVPVIEAQMFVENLPTYCGPTTIIGPFHKSTETIVTQNDEPVPTTAESAAAASSTIRTTSDRAGKLPGPFENGIRSLVFLCSKWLRSRDTGDEANWVNWDLAFAQPLKLHDSCVINVKYRVAAGAHKIKVGETDSYDYETVRFPVKKLTLTVTHNGAATIGLREGSVTVVASLEKRVNESEEARARRTIVALNNGYRYTIHFLLQPAKYTMTWQVGKPIPSSNRPKS